jgi:hypothetical protein
VSVLQPGEVRVVERRSISDMLTSAANGWHERRAVPTTVDHAWLELVCTYGSESSDEQILLLAVGPCSAEQGDVIDLGDVVRLGVLPDPAALRAPAQLALAHRLDKTARGWIARCDRPARSEYEALLSQVEALYPDRGPPAQISATARDALSRLQEAPNLASRLGASLGPNRRRGTSPAVVRTGQGRAPFVLLPLAILLQWGIVHGDRDLIDEVDHAVGRITGLDLWKEECAAARADLEVADRIIKEIGRNPGIKQVEMPDALGVEPDLARQLLWALDQAGIVMRERDGRSYRLYPRE